MTQVSGKMTTCVLLDFFTDNTHAIYKYFWKEVYLHGCQEKSCKENSKEENYQESCKTTKYLAYIVLFVFLMGWHIYYEQPIFMSKEGFFERCDRGKKPAIG